MSQLIKVVYRDYIPLYSGYSSFWDIQDPEISFEVSPARTNLKKLYTVYRKIKNFPGVAQLLPVIQRALFPSPKEDTNKYAGFFYAGILPDKIPNKPFVVDYEHAHCLFNYGEITEPLKRRILEILTSPLCIATLPWSQRAEESMQKIFKEDWAKLKNKSIVLYPALKKQPIKREFHSKPPRLLFVGKEAIRKGILELLEALSILKSQHNTEYQLTCITDFIPRKEEIPQGLNVRFLEARFSQAQLTQDFYGKNDLFIMPTREDTFGMVLLEALSTGMPVITSHQFAASEIIQPERNGFLVGGDNFYLDMWLHTPKGHNANFIKSLDKKLTQEIVTLLLNIKTNPQSLETLSKNALADFEPMQKFSLEKRHQILKNIFMPKTF